MISTDVETEQLESLEVFTCNRLPNTRRCANNRADGTCPASEGECLSRQSAIYALLRRVAVHKPHAT